MANVDGFGSELFARWGPRAPDVPQYYQEMFNSDAPGSAIVMADLAKFCMVWETSFVPGDEAQTHFNEGRRAVWLYILEMLGRDHIALHEHLKEIMTNERTSTRHLARYQLDEEERI